MKEERELQRVLRAQELRQLREEERTMKRLRMEDNRIMAQRQFQTQQDNAVLLTQAQKNRTDKLLKESNINQRSQMIQYRERDDDRAFQQELQRVTLAHRMREQEKDGASARKRAHVLDLQSTMLVKQAPQYSTFKVNTSGNNNYGDIEGAYRQLHGHRKIMQGGPEPPQLYEMQATSQQYGYSPYAPYPIQRVKPKKNEINEHQQYPYPYPHHPYNPNAPHAMPSYHQHGQG